MSKDKNDAFLIVRVPKALKDALTRQADKRGLTLSNLIRGILRASKKSS